MRDAREKAVRVLPNRALNLEKTECGFSGSPTRVRKTQVRTTGLRHVMLLPGGEEGCETLAGIVKRVRG
jgi:hypothetical protein